jgi:dTDP-4-amino-4,6-dideoxygalactose transaminase
MSTAMQTAGIPFVDLGALHAELGAELDAAWQEIRTTSAFVGGRFVERFERAWAEYCGVDHAVGVANGTDAIELALRALGIGPGDEVIVPANTFIATAEAVAATGAAPRFVDVDPANLLVSPEAVRAAINRRTAALIAVHLYGQPADIDALRPLCDRSGIALVEDAAQAHGARWRGRRAGALGDVACFSFYPGKNLGAFGDGGAVVTNDAALAERVRSLGDHGRAAEDRHLHPLVGRNSRLDAVQAAVLTIKLPHLDGWNSQRRRCAAHYRRRLADAPVELLTDDPRAEPVHHLFVVRTAAREDLIERLSRRGIGSGIHYPVPCHRQAPFEEVLATDLPEIDRASPEIISLPMYPHLRDDQIDEVAAVVLGLAEGGPGGVR